MTIGHAVNRGGASEGCIVMWAQNKGRKGQESTIVDCDGCCPGKGKSGVLLRRVK